MRARVRVCVCVAETHGVFVENPEDEGGELRWVTLREELLVDLDEALESCISRTYHSLSIQDD